MFSAFNYNSLVALITSRPLFFYKVHFQNDYIMYKVLLVENPI